MDRTSVAFVRRRDRAVEDDAWIRAFLHRAALGFLATVGEGGQPFLNSNLFVFDEPRHVIFMHTARLSRTRQNIEQRERVCFSATEMGRLLPAATALDFSVEYASVVVFGRGSLVLDEANAIPALQLLLDKYAPHLEAGRDYRPPISEEVRRTSVYRIDIEEWSGKRKAVADDFPGAFVYGQAGISS